MAEQPYPLALGEGAGGNAAEDECLAGAGRQLQQDAQHQRGAGAILRPDVVHQDRLVWPWLLILSACRRMRWTNRSGEIINPRSVLQIAGGPRAVGGNQ